MIPRYARKEAAAIWSPQTRFKIMFEIEAHAADAMAELGVIPKEAARVIWEKGRDAVWDADRIDEIEREVKHDVIAFLTHVTEIVGPEARFLHQGMTSSDVNDTTLAVQLGPNAGHGPCDRPRFQMQAIARGTRVRFDLCGCEGGGGLLQLWLLLILIARLLWYLLHTRTDAYTCESPMHSVVNILNAENGRGGETSCATCTMTHHHHHHHHHQIVLREN